MKKETCIACSKSVEASLVAVSHTIQPGASLCSGCGRRESTDPLWARGIQIGLQRAEVCQRVPRIEQEQSQ